ncbi:MAG TPA: Sua5/YciO/YrdC/YwlC family protein [Methylophilaceae bacterium]|jgi:L-threonylcarbamoyladenylate synthase
MAGSSNRGLQHYLRNGGIIAYPTESCFGLGCDPRNRLGLQRLLRIKGRPQHKGLILIGSELTQFLPYIAPINHEQQAKLNSTWPGPHTWLVPAGRHCPKTLTGRHPTIAIRVTAFKPAAKLCVQAGMALVSTSANRSGLRPAKSTRDCYRLFGDSVRIIAGRIGKRRKPSTIQDLATGRILRA